MNEDKNKFEVKLKSEMYNHDNEKIIRRETNGNKYDSNKLTLLLIGGFLLLIIVLIIITILTR